MLSLWRNGDELELTRVHSTVSKVLGDKEKYLSLPDEGSQLPIKRSKGRLPDIERTLAVWAKNQVSLICISAAHLLTGFVGEEWPTSNGRGHSQPSSRLCSDNGNARSSI